ncbi:hypothetical protein [Streptococcus loxodontisalivarius]|uniref:Uncharacterized protein n=1 Tax=Streptococcus loxodontisalivarius TaxID=1349415 RepID=A0ABS2PRW0_9STRE|nr:hypothetical protein [Streptococcus loxodontisalivarius]MBM7642762.1 hypothetical protein [Streptococcus loxodontisalivarius]
MKRLFQADFEESLNLLDDEFLQYIQKDKAGTMTPFKTILSYILFIIGVLLIFVMYYLTNSTFTNGTNEMSVQPLAINILPMWLFYLSISIIIIIWVWTKFKRIRILQIEFGSITTNNYLICLILTVNLFFTFLFGKLLGPILLVIFTCFIILVTIIAYRRSKERFLKVLYSTNDSESNFDKKLKILTKILTILMPFVIILNSIFSFIHGQNGNLIELIFIIGMWGFFNCLVVFVQFYLMLPYFLLAYYKFKYSEDYRNFEGKTKEEWYGKKSVF